MPVLALTGHIPDSKNVFEGIRLHCLFLYSGQISKKRHNCVFKIKTAYNFLNSLIMVIFAETKDTYV